MAKRKQDTLEATQVDDRMRDGGDDEGSDDEDMDMLNVDFEWFDPQPAVDFHGLKTLLRQLLDVDHDLFNLSELADLILSQPTLGSTVKVDGNETDPYSFLTVLNMHQHRDKSVIKDLAQYLIQKSLSIPALSPLIEFLSPDSQAEVGLILTERFINMPAQIVAPSYKMLLEEIQWAINDGEPYKFTHYLILSKTYTEIASRLDAEESRPSKKGKKINTLETFFFHAEDEVLQKHAIGFGGFEYTKQSDEGSSDSKRAFQEMGIKPMGSMILLDGLKFEETVKAIEEYLGSES